MASARMTSSIDTLLESASRTLPTYACNDVKIDGVLDPNGVVKKLLAVECAKQVPYTKLCIVLIEIKADAYCPPNEQLNHGLSYRLELCYVFAMEDPSPFLMGLDVSMDVIPILIHLLGQYRIVTPPYRFPISLSSLISL